jgi:hypothetical protein
MAQVIDRWDEDQRIRYFRIHGLKPGSHVVIRERASGDVVDTGKSENGLFISGYRKRPRHRYDITIRHPLCDSVVIHDTDAHTMEIKQFKDLRH